MIKKVFALIVVLAAAMTTRAMTPPPPPTYDVCGYPVMISPNVNTVLPFDIVDLLLGKVHVETDEELKAADVIVTDYHKIAESNAVLMGLNVFKHGQERDTGRTYLVTVNRDNEDRWHFVDGALIRQPGDLEALVSPLGNSMGEVELGHHEVHFDPAGAQVTRSFDIKMFVADMGTETFSNEVTFNYRVNPEDYTIALGDTTSSGIISFPGGAGMLPGQYIPPSRSFVSAFIPEESLALLQAVNAPVSDTARFARWNEVASAAEPESKFAIYAMAGGTALCRQDALAFMNAVPLDNKDFFMRAVAVVQTVETKASLKKLLKQLPAAKAKVWKKYL